MEKNLKKFEFVEHTADVKFKAYGRSLDEVFENSVFAFSKITAGKKKIKRAKKKNLKIKGKGAENLIYNLINELVYLLDAENFIASDARIKVSDDLKQLEAEIYGDSSEKYRGLFHIKSATYHDIFLKRNKNNLWEAQVVVDV